MNNWKYFLLFFLLPPTLTREACPHGWMDGTVVDMGCLFFNHTAQVTWLEGVQSCQQGFEGASYVEIRTPEVIQ